jgi:hypothetical protein
MTEAPTEAIMETLNQTLTQRVDDLIEASRSEKLLSTTGTRTAVEELIRRNEGVERIVFELALEVEKLAAVVAELRNPSGDYTITLPAIDT